MIIDISLITNISHHRDEALEARPQTRSGQTAAAFAPRLAAQLERLGIARNVIAEEIAHASPLVLARAATPNRRALGHLVEICFQIRAMDDQLGALATNAGLDACENFLADKFPHTQRKPDFFADLAVRRILAAVVH